MYFANKIVKVNIFCASAHTHTKNLDTFIIRRFYLHYYFSSEKICNGDLLNRKRTYREMFLLIKSKMCISSISNLPVQILIGLLWSVKTIKQNPEKTCIRRHKGLNASSSFYF